MKKTAIVFLAALAFAGASCDKTQQQTSDAYYSNEQTQPPAPQIIETPMQEPEDKSGPIVILKTDLGEITLQLFENAAPKTVENFVTLAEKDFYDGIQFHRIIKDFMIQGGDPLSKSEPQNYAMHGRGGPGYQFEDEINGFKIVRGRIAMANAGPDTNGSQFFIVTTPAAEWLDGRHTVFGEVIKGMDVVDAIENVETNAADHPVNPLKIQDVIVQKP